MGLWVGIPSADTARDGPCVCCIGRRYPGAATRAWATPVACPGKIYEGFMRRPLPGMESLRGVREYLRGGNFAARCTDNGHAHPRFALAVSPGCSLHGEGVMDVMHIAVGVISVGLFAYLIFALIKPEKFE